MTELLRQTEEAPERNIENRTRAFENQKQWSHRQPKLSNHGLLQVLHDENNQSDNNYNFLHGKNN